MYGRTQSYRLKFHEFSENGLLPHLWLVFVEVYPTQHRQNECCRFACTGLRLTNHILRPRAGH